MNKLTAGTLVATFSVLAATAASVSAQTWPLKPIRVVSAGTGGALDLTLRAIGQVLAPALGQRLVVENRASSTLPEQVILKSAPDGYTLMYWANPLWLSPFVMDVDYDPSKDFAPISLVA